MYSYSKSLEDLDFVVIDGRMVYPTEQSTSQKDTIQSKPKKDQPTKKPNKEVKEVHIAEMDLELIRVFNKYFQPQT